MQEGTICPFLIISSPSIPPITISIKLMNKAKLHIEQCDKKGIKLTVSKSVLNILSEMFPWNCQHADDQMRQYIAFWRRSIFTPLLRCSDNTLSNTIPIRSHQNNSFNCDIERSQRLIYHWAYWLSQWSKGIKINGRCSKGIGSDYSCCGTATASLCHSSFILVFNAQDWELVRFPMYLRYDRKLPAQGEFPFQPPTNWQTRAIAKGVNHGYLDDAGNEWVWDRLHNNHWDVTIASGGKYIRVNSEGHII